MAFSFHFYFIVPQNKANLAANTQFKLEKAKSERQINKRTHKYPRTLMSKLNFLLENNLSL